MNIVKNIETSQRKLQKELFETRNERFREEHKHDQFPEDWGTKTNDGRYSRVAGFSFEEAEADDRYVE